ncbi:hypothetical protein M1P56_19405 [Streptomyces sp. HU2014]|uniref:Uncharacterized protein n=1 Tax=Streptomyces albireticuli TaxID=1940 RepID=A0A1Z2KVN0_9ACTN|nr:MULTISPECIES: hypothetical protein [Streptomyces]ARZ66102.1 hypothetical protein SMD11_0436 [Streptomyces albireticuli]UQI46358.1 hypothetical protein M1P56_19405 [Streptomyces sp. HU2014]
MSDHKTALASDGLADPMANPEVKHARLTLKQSEDGTLTLTVSEGNAIAKGIRVEDEAGKLLAAYVALSVDDLSVAKSMQSAVSGAVAHTIDGISEKQAAKAEAPSGIIVGQAGPDTPVKLSPDEFREKVVATLANDLVDLSRDLRR